MLRSMRATAGDSRVLATGRRASRARFLLAWFAGVLLLVPPIASHGRAQETIQGVSLQSLYKELQGHYRKRDLAAAEGAVSRARNAGWDLSDLHRVDGMAADDAGLHDLAIEKLRRCVGQQPDDYQGWVLLCRALHGKDPQRGGVEEARRAIALRPDLSHAYVSLSQIYIERSQLKEGLAALDEGLGHPRLTTDLELLQKRCILLMISGRYEETLVTARLLVEHHAERADGHFFLGQVFGNRGELEASLAEHQRAVELAPKNAYYQLHLGITLRRLHRYREAWSVLRTAKKLDPENPTVRYNLAQVLVALGRKSEAQAEMNDYYRFRAFQKKR